MQLLLIFILLNIVNVIIQTIKSIATVKYNKYIASIINALAYGIYTIVLVYMNCDLTLLEKVCVVATTNLIGVFVVKLIEEKMRKQKLWKVEATISSSQKFSLIKTLENSNLQFSYINIGSHCIFNFYCRTQTESKKVREILKDYKAKYFVSESLSL